jgi:FkbM family methyltransferase
MLATLRHHWHATVPPYLGQIAKYRGFVSMYGCRFDVSSPAVSKALAGIMVQGNYEGFELEAIERFLNPELPIVECGGAMGITACVANRRLKRPADHRVVEPNPISWPLLEANRRLNGAQFTIVQAAIGYDAATVAIEPNHDILCATIGTGAVEVPTTSLAEQAGDWSAITLMCDIEGIEVDMIEREADVIRRCVHTLILEVHPQLTGQPKVDAMLARVREVGLGQVWRRDNVLVCRR